MKGRPLPYSAYELAWLEERKEWPRAALHRAFVVLFQRHDVSKSALTGLMKRKGWMTGRPGCFAKGQAPHNTKRLGHERLSKEGYIKISVAETNPHTGYGRRYVHKHVHLWEAANGPVPEGYCLKSLDGDKTNTDPSNWTAIPRGVLPRLNGGRATRVMAYDSAPDELKPAILTIAKIDHRARELRRQRKDAA